MLSFVAAVNVVVVAVLVVIAVADLLFVVVMDIVVAVFPVNCYCSSCYCKFKKIYTIPDKQSNHNKPVELEIEPRKINCPHAVCSHNVKNFE